MSTAIKAAGPKRRKTAKAELTEYESKQVEDIAHWKSRPPNPLDEIAKKITEPVAHWVEKVIPDAVIRAAIEKAYDISQRVAGQEDIKRQAGVTDLAELKKKPLEECDQLAFQVSRFANAWALAEGIATGAGGFLTTVIDGFLLFVLTLRTIMRIGHCYGYSLDHRRDQAFVLGVYLTAMSGTLHTKRCRLEALKEMEELLISETQREILAEELLAFVFQLEIFEEVPGIGAISGALLNIGVMRRVERTTRRVFQERWLRDNGKVHAIAPAPAHERAVARGWAGVLKRAAYSGCYGVGFAAALPATILASVFWPMDNALTQGARDGAAAAARSAERVVGRAPQARGGQETFAEEGGTRSGHLDPERDDRSAVGNQASAAATRTPAIQNTKPACPRSSTAIQSRPFLRKPASQSRRRESADSSHFHRVRTITAEKAQTAITAGRAGRRAHRTGPLGSAVSRRKAD